MPRLTFTSPLGQCRVRAKEGKGAFIAGFGVGAYQIVGRKQGLRAY